MHKLLKNKHFGILIPLFTMYSDDDFGCGDSGSLNEWIDFASEIGFDVIQILPINEMPPHTNCPYTSLTAFAIDPVYISIKDIEELSPEIKNEIKSKDFKEKIKVLKKKDYIDYDEIKRIKYEILWRQYNYFVKNGAENKKKEFEEYKAKNNWWLDNYAVFRRLKDIHNWSSWTLWEEAFKNPNSEKLSNLKKEDSFNIDFFKYIQWELDKQFTRVKHKLDKKNIHLLGDLPFMVNQESADVWSRQYDFRLDLESGAPPDAFSAEGQRWGIPAPDWENQISNNFEWWRLKVKRFEELFDIFRIDHMVGFFRTWVIPKDKNIPPHFDIIDPVKQEERGRLFLKTMKQSTHMLPIAEDLGVIPDYVRKILKELDICGYKVMRWEKEKDNYIDPENYYPVSVAVSSTHDTEPMNTWWKMMDRKEKEAFCKMLYKTENLKIPKGYKEIKDIVNHRLINSSSIFSILTIQDILSTDERINEPGTVGNHNWSWRIRKRWEDFYEKYKKDFDFIKKEISKKKNEKTDIN